MSVHQARHILADQGRSRWSVLDNRHDQQWAQFAGQGATDLPRSYPLVVSNLCSRHAPLGFSWPRGRFSRNTDLASFASVTRSLLAIRVYDRLFTSRQSHRHGIE